MRTGRLEEITDPEQLARAHQLPLSPWALANPDHYVQLPIELLSGRRINRLRTWRRCMNRRSNLTTTRQIEQSSDAEECFVLLRWEIIGRLGVSHSRSSTSRSCR